MLSHPPSPDIDDLLDRIEMLLQVQDDRLLQDMENLAVGSKFFCMGFNDHHIELGQHRASARGNGYAHMAHHQRIMFRLRRRHRHSHRQGLIGIEERDMHHHWHRQFMITVLYVVVISPLW